MDEHQDQADDPNVGEPQPLEDLNLDDQDGDDVKGGLLLPNIQSARDPATRR